MQAVKCSVVLFLLALQNNILFSQTPSTDTLHITLDSAQNMFVRNNSHQAGTALQILTFRKRLFYKPGYTTIPTLHWAWVFTTPYRTLFATGSGQKVGELISQLPQLVILAGKRNSRSKLPKPTPNFPKNSLRPVTHLRALLRTDFFNIYYLQQFTKYMPVKLMGLITWSEPLMIKGQRATLPKGNGLRVEAQLYEFTEWIQWPPSIVDVLVRELRLVLQNASQCIPFTLLLTRCTFNNVNTINSLTLRTGWRFPELNGSACDYPDISKLNYDYQALARSGCYPFIQVMIGRAVISAIFNSNWAFIPILIVTEISKSAKPIPTNNETLQKRQHWRKYLLLTAETHWRRQAI